MSEQQVKDAMRYLADGGKGCGTWVQYGQGNSGFRLDYAAKQFIALEEEIERQRQLIDLYLPNIITGVSAVVYGENVQKTRDELSPEEVGLRAALSAAHWLAKEFADPAIGHGEPLYDLPSVQDLLRTRKDSDRKAAVRTLMDTAEDYERQWGLDGVPEWLRERAEKIGREN